MSAPCRVFLLSPASATGARAASLLSGRSGSELAVRIARPPGVELGELFTFVSSLYFRGKLAYARRFQRPPPHERGVWVLTADRGLVAPEIRVDLSDLAAFARARIDPEEPAYVEPLLSTAGRLAERIGTDGEAVLLGSLATDKYVAPLERVFGERLRVPEAFVGRGDMSRGGLLLRRVRAERELAYARPADLPRRGSRPPRLDSVR